ncbi:hypothetical protein FE257_001820 [Aspergillus nanangensis]|uniref:Uncharacterized protein n=1 Tax=Aspergillus nanangensis TaxID=2582783 RepID=A0AAD4CDA9_ASPNN|nr:hypothetical protein FE257_001820 [Aspergillus nanangensis]
MNPIDFDSQIKPRLEAQIPQIGDPLLDTETQKVNSWVDLLAETDESLMKRSSTQRSVRRRARHFARKVYAISPELFVLCSLSYTISSLPRIPPGMFNEFQNWWALQSPSEPHSNITSTICRNLPRNTGDNHNFLPPSELSEPKSPPRQRKYNNLQQTEKRKRNVANGEDSRSQNYNTGILYSNQGQDSSQTSEYERAAINETNGHYVGEPSEPLLKRPRLESQVLGNTTLFSDGPYLSFSFMRRHMVDKLPEQLRTGIETSKLWTEERERGGLSVTNCLSLYLPEKINEDALLVIRIGYSEGFNVSNVLGLGDPEGLDEA